LNNQIVEQAAELHKRTVVLDAHCDTLTVLAQQNRNLGQLGKRGHIDLPRLRVGGVNVQFFAAFIAPEHYNAPLKRALELIDIFYNEIERNKNYINHVNNFDDIIHTLSLNKIAALLCIEGGECLEGSIEVLRQLYKHGVRCLTLTWNNSNELGNGVYATATSGLTKFGFDVVEELNQLGMLVDVSHLSEAGFYDVLRHSRQPVIASHSNCQAICRHPRNLTDQQIKSLADKGGVMGITFVPEFVGGDEASIDEVLNHIDHAVAIGGIDCVGFGSDFDGTDTLVGVEDCTSWPLLTCKLIERGYHEEEIEKILGGNFMRVIGQVLK